MAQEGVYVFPDAATRSAVNGIDPGLLALLNQNGGFGGMEIGFGFFSSG